MSECVVRMEMPKGNCQLAVEIPYVGDWCPILAKTCDYSMTKRMPKDCPILCQLPEWHGRLVDADALYKKRYIVEPGDILASITVVDACYISGAQTIVPAERSET